MKIEIALALTAAVVPLNIALACAPPPPGYVHPTETELLSRFVTNADDIVYGIITHSQNGRSRFNVIHVYKGGLTKGQTIETTTGWDFPVPYCAGMGGPPIPKPIGTYGVAVLKNGSSGLGFIAPRHVQTMIANGWIKSARGR
jgi:hypothetical protein